jgi:hypothetical protein
LLEFSLKSGIKGPLFTAVKNRRLMAQKVQKEKQIESVNYKKTAAKQSGLYY